MSSLDELADSNGLQPDQLKPRRNGTASRSSLHGIDRLPPHSIEAEQGVLGCLLLDARGFDDVLAKIGAIEAFYDLRHRTIFEAIQTLLELRQPVDGITVPTALKNLDQLEAVGGVGYLNSLMDSVPSAANLFYYVPIVRDKFIMRRTLEVCGDIIGRVYEAGMTKADELVNDLQAGLLALSNITQRENCMHLISHWTNSVIDHCEALHQAHGQHINGLRTGLPDLDRILNGLGAGKVYIIAGRPGGGKTTLMMNIFEHIGLIESIPVGVISLEMVGQELALRMASSVARVPFAPDDAVAWNHMDFARITGAVAKMHASKIVISDASGMTLSAMKSQARKMVAEHGIKVLGLDYLQLITCPSARKGGGTREQEIGEIANGLKSLAKELDIPVVALSQLGRGTEKENREPRMSDLRESGSIEAAADAIVFLYNEDEGKSGDPVRTIIAKTGKNRGGRVGKTRLTFFAKYTRMESASNFLPEDESPQ